jgi:uncharacterized membrane protein
MKETTVIRVAMVCAMVGMGLSLYIQLIESGFDAPGCRINSWIDCHKVLEYKQFTGIIFGIPNQIVALCGFSLVFTLGFLRLRFPDLPHSDKIIFVMTGLNTFGACLGTYLQTISVTVIHYVCPFCVSAYTCDLISLTFESTFLIGMYRKYLERKKGEGDKESPTSS